MKKVDILFLYETKVRELENICLLKYELEHRGYSVAILNTWNELGYTGRPKYDARVVVTHAMYHDGIYEFVRSIVGKVPKVVNMQCEQIGTIKDEQSEDCCFFLKGVAKECMNICWGDRTVNRLLQHSDVDRDHLGKTGNITLDFCRPELRSFYATRDEIVRRYALPQDKQINLFISSFSYVNLPENIQKESDLPDKDVIVRLSNQSHVAIVDWFSRFLKEHPDQVLVYRPHPAEADNERLQRLKADYPDQFYVISELSVKQWIAVVDRVYTWYSTAAAEAVVFGVPFAILRPVPFPPELELSLYENATLTESYEAFCDTLEGPLTTPISPSVFSELYELDKTLSYIRVADEIERVLLDDSYLIQHPPALQTPPLKSRVKSALRRGVTWIADCVLKQSEWLARYRTPEETVDPYTVKLQQNNYASDKEIEQIQNRIAAILNGGDQ